MATYYIDLIDLILICKYSVQNLPDFATIDLVWSLAQSIWESLLGRLRLWVECRLKVLIGNLVDTLKSEPRGVKN